MSYDEALAARVRRMLADRTEVVEKKMLMRLPPSSPHLNAYAERFVRMVREECLRHIIPLGECHLRGVIHDFVEHYHVERNRQGLGHVIPFPSRASTQFEGTVCRRQRLGGVLSFYERKAA
jgi:transposase InsO family protein